jgi:hypothetical protein
MVYKVASGGSGNGWGTANQVTEAQRAVVAQGVYTGTTI